MAEFKKIDGAWVQAQEIWVKRSGVWTPITQSYAKRLGTWQTSYINDTTPPDTPELSVQIVDRQSSGRLVGRWVNVGVRAGTVHNPDIRRIRVLTTYNKTWPTTPLGGTYTSAGASNFPAEPWSDWHYNGYQGSTHPNNNTFSYKRWPRNAADSYIAPTGTVYHFTAWAEDWGGNWSAVASAQLTMPNTVNAASTLYKQTRFITTATGTLTSNAGFTEGDLVQSYNVSNGVYTTGMYFYGNEIPTAIGAGGTPTVTNAQIAVHRQAEDAGPAMANVYLFVHGYASPADVPSTGRALSSVTYLGQIAKGEGKWFTIPKTIWPYLNTTVKGFGLFYKNPVFATGFAADSSTIKGQESYFRAGEVVVSWREG